MQVAHGTPVAPSELGGAWTFEPVTVAALVLAGALYAAGAAALRSSPAGRRALPPLRLVAFGLGLAAAGGALVSPLHALGEALFSAHMLQHIVLVMIAPILLVLGRPLLVMQAAMPPGARVAVSRAGRKLARPVTASPSWPFAVLLVHAVVLWVWHAPGLYQAALASPALHALEHATFFATALVFWSVLLHSGARSVLSAPAAVLYVFLAALQSGALGALLTFAPAPLYPDYAAGAALWGRDLLVDQSLGGLLMWIPGSIAYAIAALWILASYLSHLDRSLPHAPPEPGGRL
jgi:putative membrane protein